MSLVLASRKAALLAPWLRNPLWAAARAVPSLDLRFADSKSLVDAVSGQSLVTYTRASDATFVNSQGVLTTASSNTPRFDHNPTTGESLGLLIEEQRQNLLLRSEEFNDAYWTKTNATVTADSTQAPSGATAADSVVENTANGLHRVTHSSISFTAGTVYTLSVFARSTTRNLYINATGAIGARASFNLTNGTINVVGQGSAVITPFPNGWYRCSVTGTAPSTISGGTFFQINTNALAADESYTGDGTSGILLWGAQLEAGAFPTSYIPTTGTAATRSADVADLISAAIANNIRSSYVEFSSPAVGTRGAVSLNDNTANERLAVITSGTDPRLVVHDGGVEQANIDGGTVTANDRTRVAVRIGTNDFAISVNGGAVVTDTSGTLPTVDRLMLGRTQAGEYLNGRLARFVGWSQLLPDSTLQTLGR